MPTDAQTSPTVLVALEWTGEVQMIEIIIIISFTAPLYNVIIIFEMLLFGELTTGTTTVGRPLLR